VDEGKPDQVYHEREFDSGFKSECNLLPNNILETPHLNSFSAQYILPVGKLNFGGRALFGRVFHHHPISALYFSIASTTLYCYEVLPVDRHSGQILALSLILSSRSVQPSATMERDTPANSGL